MILKFTGRVEKILTGSISVTRCQRTCLFEWHRRFKEGRDEVEDDHRNGRPFTSRTDENIERVRLKVRSDRRLTVKMIADVLGIDSEGGMDGSLRKIWG